MLRGSAGGCYSEAMAGEQPSAKQWETWTFEPGPFDVHAHPRVFDAITRDGFITTNEGAEGKAGLQAYTRTALRSGITGMAAMPNESVRLYDSRSSELTEEIPYPIASLDRVRAMQAAISHEALIPAGLHMGLDPETAFRDMDRRRLNTGLLARQFEAVSGECLALKVYLAETTGGNNIALEHGAAVADVWRRVNSDKPVIFHVEGEDVAELFKNVYHLPGGKDIPLHIAHVSSRQEMEAVIAAKEAGMNVTCEVTPHHLFLDESVREEIGGYGCMKPSLKTPDDIDFLWDNMRYIDIFASDCAPHRISDKERDNPAFGVTNHTVMLPLLIGAVKAGRLTMEDVEEKFCRAPRKRFNMPLHDGSFVTVKTDEPTLEQPELYGQNPFRQLDREFQLVGNIVMVKAGVSATGMFGENLARPSYTHLIRPQNIKL